MSEETNISNIIYNVIRENRYSHCRLCLKAIQNEYVRFQDEVSLNPESGLVQPLAEILTKLLGEKVGILKYSLFLNTQNCLLSFSR